MPESPDAATFPNMFRPAATANDMAGMTNPQVARRLGSATFNVGTGGAAFGVADGTVIRVIDILRVVDDLTVASVLHGGSANLRKLANTLSTDRPP